MDGEITEEDVQVVAAYPAMRLRPFAGPREAPGALLLTSVRHAAANRPPVKTELRNTVRESIR